MRAPTRPGGQPRRPGPLAEIRATGTRRRRLVERRAPDPGPRAAWAFAVVALVLGVGLIVLIAFDGIDVRTAAPPSAVASVPPGTPRTPTPSPTDALAVAGNGAGAPAGTPTRPPITTPTRAPADAGPAPFRVDFPVDGETVVSRRINVFGHAAGGARVLRELPDGSVMEAVARPDGLWILGVDLQPGLNELRFRVDGQPGEPVVVHVTWRRR